MNIFELIASDPAGYQRVSNDLGNYKHHWTLFKQLVAELLAIHSDNVDFLVSRMTTVWRSIVQSSPEIIGMSLDYYTCTNAVS